MKTYSTKTTFNSINKPNEIQVTAVGDTHNINIFTLSQDGYLSETMHITEA